MKKKAVRSGFVSRAAVTRRPVQRMTVILGRIGEGKFVNCSDLAEELEVNRKTVRRDIEFMRCDMDLPIEYDARRHGYYLERPVSELPLFRLTQGELLALFVAERALGNGGALAGTEIEGQVRAGLEKLAAGLPEEVSVSWGELGEALSFRQSGVAVLEGAEVFDALTGAVRERREVAFEYRKHGAGRFSVRHVRPYHVGFVDGAWYLFGHDLKRDAERTFALVRVRGVSVRKRVFERPAGWALEARLGDSFGVFSGDGKVRRVRVRFTGYAARYVAERLWHPSQKVVERRDGSVVVTLRLGSLWEVARWVRGWGREAEVLEPGELAEMVGSR